MPQYVGMLISDDSAEKLKRLSGGAHFDRYRSVLDRAIALLTLVEQTRHDVGRCIITQSGITVECADGSTQHIAWDTLSPPVPIKKRWFQRKAPSR